MYVAAINKLNLQGVEKREESQFRDLRELLGWALSSSVVLNLFQTVARFVHLESLRGPLLCEPPPLNP